ncbi:MULTISPECIES: SDR family NAD(P)-dependent oxidoreductase [unclassified Nitratiruptor]|uniref:SDR family NAD(P)-dependent oxidoreductase n=1 Tax=unclassified Nitratiruptor TaxID=2624044 RepID=UPI001915D9FC|nr:MULTISPECIES: SDR family NAD(P)-dependent oxidoreductase [unclassified Nitratiruptor]BCD61036.1 alcohol dehydrogenase [Nitratiruptor sp. YY08-10]BCD64968.1 alcohol dehydrogenase [Nitratiruptor sp. YY08-14]
MKIFITGIGSGLGEALAKLYLEAGEEVYALSRTLPRSLRNFSNLHFVSLNLHAHEKIELALVKLLDGVELDLAILNAGIVGELKDMSDTSLHEILAVMDLNVWANKVILDILKRYTVKQVVAISSGASVSGARGWNVYALSKATLNMLIKLYAAEMPNTHLTALAPGLIDTPMMEHILQYGDQEKFPVVKRLAESPKMSPEEAAVLLSDNFKRLLEYPSGEFIDIRNLP